MTIASLSRTFAAWTVRPHHLALLLAAPASACAAAAEDPFASLISAERAFAADALRIGITPAFRAHAGADSVLIRPDPLPALEVLAHEVDDPEISLHWEPALAGIAGSNDLGFTTGPYRLVRGAEVLQGSFLTIWQRDSEGRWRWYLDHGLAPSADARQPSRPHAVTRLPSGVRPAGLPRDATDLTSTEDAVNDDYLARGPVALGDVLANDGLIFRGQETAAAGAEGGAGGFVGAERLGLRVSAGHDLAATFGRFLRPEGRRPIYYVRVWRREPAGWRLLVDQLD